MPKKDDIINSKEIQDKVDRRDHVWTVWSQGPDKAKETSRKFKQPTPGQVRDYKHFVSNRRFQRFEQVESVQQEDAPVNSVAGGGVDMAPNAKGTKVFIKRKKLDGRTKEYREANKRISDRKEKIQMKKIQKQLSQFGVVSSPYTEETENNRYLETKGGSIEDAIIKALTTFENPNDERETLTLPKKEVEVEEGFGKLKDASKNLAKMHKAMGLKKDKTTTKKTAQGGTVQKTTYKKANEEKKSGYLEPNMKKRQDNNEKARKDMKKMAPPMKNPHLEEVEVEALDLKKIRAQRQAKAAGRMKDVEKVFNKKTKPTRDDKVYPRQDASDRGYFEQTEIDELSNKTMDSYAQKASASQSDAEKKQDYKTADKRISGKMRASRRQFSNDTNRILKGLKKESKETENGERDAGSDKYTNYTKEMTPGQGITNDDAKKADVRKKKEQAAQQQQLNVDENMEKYLKTKPMSLESAVLEALMGEKHNPDHYNKQTTTQVGSKQKMKPSYNTKTHKMVTKPGGGVSIVPKSTPGTAAESTQVKHEKGDKHDEVPEKRAGESDKDHKERTAGRVSFKQHRRSLDAVNPDELKGKHKDRDDKDIDNDGDVDGSDKFLHRRRQAIASKQKKEEVKIDELSKKTLGSYVKKASVDKSNATLDLGISQGPKQTRADVTKHAGKAIKRQKGINKAVDKLSKEEVEEAKYVARGAPSPKYIQGPARRYDSPLDSPKAIAAREKLRKVMKGIKKKDPDHPAVQNIKDK